MKDIQIIKEEILDALEPQRTCEFCGEKFKKIPEEYSKCEFCRNGKFKH